MRLCAYKPSRINSPADARNASLSFSLSPNLPSEVQEILDLAKLVDHFLRRQIFIEPQATAQFKPLHHLAQIHAVEIGSEDFAHSVA